MQIGLRFGIDTFSDWEQILGETGVGRGTGWGGGGGGGGGVGGGGACVLTFVLSCVYNYMIKYVPHSNSLQYALMVVSCSKQIYNTGVAYELQ